MSGRNYRITILQSCDEFYAPCLAATTARNAAYARMYNYTYSKFIGNISSIPGTSNFNRYYMLRHLIQQQVSDWALWMDADAIVVDDTIPLESIIDRSPDKLIIACRGSMNGDHDINNGVFFLNLRHELAASLAQHCIEYCESLDRDVSGFRDDQHELHAWLHARRDGSGRVPLAHCYRDDEYNLFNYDGRFIRHVLREFGSLDERVEELQRLASGDFPRNDGASEILVEHAIPPENPLMLFQKKHGILVAAPAAYEQIPLSSQTLLESCHRYGIELTLLGQGRPYPNHLYKVELVAEYLAQHPEIRYVLQVDLVDVVFCATLWEMFVKYKSFNHAIVAAAERVHWPIPSHHHRSPETGTSCRYLNSGTIFATREAWLNAWQHMQEKVNNPVGLASDVSPQEIEFLRHDDQAAWSDLYITGEADIAIDSQCTLFQVLNQTDWSIGAANRDFVFEGRRIVNRETGERPCLIHANAKIPLEPWAKYVLHPPTVWLWPLIRRIRTAPLRSLKDIGWVETLLLELGLHDPVEGVVQESLLSYTGKGLSIWQRPNEFAAYLVWLSKLPAIHSYLEIGVEQGGSFITTIEFLRRFHSLRVAIGVDPWMSNPVLEYTRRTAGVHFVRGTQASNELRRLVEQIGRVDLVLIDGDHSHQGVRADWDFAKSRSNYVAFHDIAADNLPGVKTLWNEIRESHRHTYEFVDDHWQPNLWAGLGVVKLDS